MKHRLIIAMTFSLLIALVVIVVTIEASSLGWRLPFDGVVTITNGPGEGMHTGASREAIDYARNAASFSVIAPADGVVIDYLTNGTQEFGNLLRIYHPNSGSCSLFAHLTTASVTTGNVIQGQVVGTSGKSGLPVGSGIHLHFEARNNCLAGQPFSGSAVSIRAIPGTWWRSSYELPYTPIPHVPAAPPIPTSDQSQYGGAAQYPPDSHQPAPLAQTVTARLLSNPQSPPNTPNGWITNVVLGNPGTAWLFFAGNPNVVAATPASSYRTSFALYKWAPGCVPSPTVNCFDLIINSYKLKKQQSLSAANESFPGNHQYTYVMYSTNAVYGTSNDARIYEFYAGDNAPALDTPHLVIVLEENSAPTILEYCSSGTDQYQVMEAHGGPTTTAYQGSACSIVLQRNVGGTNNYSVRAHYSGGRSATTPFVTLHY